MKRINYGSTALWNTILFILIILAVFVLPVLPSFWHRSLLRTVYTFLIASMGQFYIVIIVALLVSKLSAQNITRSD
ncbi:MAG: hypothetical protein IPJ37_04205 [Bacteroidales bacterium]|nr:hypothetical protein [Bacteroidales bacterium]